MRVVSVALRKIRSAATFTPAQIALILPVFVALGLARITILVLPFRYYVGLFGPSFGVEATPDPVAERDMLRLRRIGVVIRSTARITPWQSLCLVQAMVASVVLRLSGLPFRVYFGVAPNTGPDEDPLAAHAWVTAGDTNVTGGQDVSRYTIVQVFKRSAAALR